jgi:hypothetical protein
MSATRVLTSFCFRALAATVFIVGGAMGAFAQQGPPDGVPGRGPVVEVEGELDVIYEDHDQEGRLLFFLERDDNRQRVRLKFENNDEPNLLSGTRVRVRGNIDAADGSLTTTTSSVTSMAINPLRTLGAQHVLVILMNFSNNPTQAFSATTIASINDQVRNFYLENSYGQTNINFTVKGWYTIAATDTTCDYYTWASQAEAAATAAGVDLAAYDRRMFAFPKAAGCTWAGTANLGGVRSWINGSYILRTVAHEQGHNLGNYHSRAVTCDSTACVTNDYGDDRDVLGVPGTVGHMNAFQKERLGFLNYGASPVIQTVTTSGDYWIDNYELLRGGSKALKIWNAAKSSYYYVESRAKSGFDVNIAAGVTLHLGSPTSGYGHQVDLAPLTTAWDSTLDGSQVFTDPAMGLSMQTLSSSVDGATIRVVFDGGSPTSCTRTAPTVTVSPSSQTVAAGTTTQFAMSVKNNNASSCPASTFAVAATVPSGWATSVVGGTLSSLAPGATTNATLSVAVPAGSSGSYPFQVTATDTSGGAVGAASASITASSGSESTISSLSVTVAAAVNGRQLSTSTSVRSNGMPVRGANVMVTLKPPTGANLTLSGVTADDGVVLLNYMVKPKDPQGTWQVQSVATSGSVSGSATTSVATSNK